MYKSVSFEETCCKKTANSEDEYSKMQGMRKGPWTIEEDSLLINSISSHGEGHWSSLAYSSGLKRSGKSCRLRWLNYLRPDVRRGNITLQEQLLILELHSLWGNRWSKIAEQLPGRTDNEIKNYWRTRVQKQAKQLKCDVNSKQFSDAMRHIWMPRLAERIQAQNRSLTGHHMTGMGEKTVINIGFESGFGQADPTLSHEMSGCSSSSLETQVSMVSDHNDSNNFPGGNDFFGSGFGPELVADSYAMQQEKDGLGYENMLSDEDILSLLQQCDYEV